MGAGNWRSNLEGAQTVHLWVETEIEIEDEFGETEMLDPTDAYEAEMSDLLFEIENSLPPSFEWRYRSDRPEWTDDGILLAQHGHAAVYIKSWYGSEYITVAPRQHIDPWTGEAQVNPLSYRYVTGFAPKLWDKLEEQGQELYVPMGAWMSAKRNKN